MKLVDYIHVNQTDWGRQTQIKRQTGWRQKQALDYLKEHPCDMSELAKGIGCSKAVARAVLTRLKKKGQVRNSIWMVQE